MHRYMGLTPILVDVGLVERYLLIGKCVATFIKILELQWKLITIVLDCQQNEIIIKHWKKIQLACVYLKLDIKLYRPLLAFLQMNRIRNLFDNKVTSTKQL